MSGKTTGRRIAFNGRKLLTAVILAAAAAVILFVINMELGASGEVISYSSDSRTEFRTYGNETLKYNKDGAVFYNRAWEQQWSDPYTMTAPIATARGDYTAVYETDGRNLRVYNQDGLVYNIQTSDTIMSVSVSENGSTGVITSGTSYMVTVYSPSGNMLFQRVEADTGVYPMCCDVSPDGDIIAISYMDTTGVVIKTKIGFFYVNADKGADYTDSMFAAVSKQDEIVFKLYFTSKSGLTAVGDRHIMTFSSAGVEESSVEVTNEISAVGLCGNKIAVVYGDELSDKEGTEQGTVIFVASGGGISEGCSIGTEPEYAMVSEGGIVLGDGSSYYGVSSGGKLEWTLSSGGNIDIYPTSNVNRCIYSAKTWAVAADMRGFNASEYEPTAAVNALTEIGDGETDEVTEPTEGDESGSQENNGETEKSEDENGSAQEAEKNTKVQENA